MEVLIAIVALLAILLAMVWYLDRRGNRRRRGLPPSHELEREIGPDASTACHGGWTHRHGRLGLRQRWSLAVVNECVE